MKFKAERIACASPILPREGTTLKPEQRDFQFPPPELNQKLETETSAGSRRF